MSRSGYVDDYDSDDNSFYLYRGRVASATRGKRGQKLLRDILDALDAMPEKRLITGEIETPTGSVCALGAAGKARGLDMTDLDPDDSVMVASIFDIADCLAREIVYVNDECGPFKRKIGVCMSCHGWGETMESWRYYPTAIRPITCRRCSGTGRAEHSVSETPEERWARMRAWVASQIVAAPLPAQTEARDGG